MSKKMTEEIQVGRAEKRAINRYLWAVDEVLRLAERALAAKGAYLKTIQGGIKAKKAKV